MVRPISYRSYGINVYRSINIYKSALNAAKPKRERHMIIYMKSIFEELNSNGNTNRVSKRISAIMFIINWAIYFLWSNGNAMYHNNWKNTIKPSN